MFARVHKLRTLGALEAGAPPLHDTWTRGILEFSTSVGDGQRFGPRRLILRHSQADPTRGVIFELYKPELIDIREPCLKVRGIEPMATGAGTVAAMMQEWLVILRP